MPSFKPTLTVVDHPDQFPCTNHAFIKPNGLLAFSTQITSDWLKIAYSKGIFPWYNPNEPVLWWSPNPRAVLYVNDFKLHRSLHKAVLKASKQINHQVSLNANFEAVIRACAEPRAYADSTWISEPIIQSYCELHRQGLAHSVEYTINRQLVGGLYCVSLGKMVFGESMFARQTDASKIAFSFFIHWLKLQGVKLIDCQQSTNHLNFLGATTISRIKFENELQTEINRPNLDWRPKTLYWKND